MAGSAPGVTNIYCTQQHINHAGSFPHLALQLAKFITEADEELAISLLLVAREGENTRQVVPLLTVLLLAEVTHLHNRGEGRKRQALLDINTAHLTD